ncbi:hypothetical protein QNM97_20210 [Gordonia sp. L191]|uniref:hypothetical protein n=1 Tax=Gordonia sp. L191 TaxID=2982699 RepID=UPI0024BF5FF9|nr:hypothetical protein [Gordonia sp. L191]WHU50158.1 hypothetical protein QNM97_20210 [Gordonia sp. L191]
MPLTGPERIRSARKRVPEVHCPLSSAHSGGFRPATRDIDNADDAHAWFIDAQADNTELGFWITGQTMFATSYYTTRWADLCSPTTGFRCCRAGMFAVRRVAGGQVERVTPYSGGSASCFGDL